MLLIHCFMYIPLFVGVLCLVSVSSMRYLVSSGEMVVLLLLSFLHLVTVIALYGSS